MKIYTKTGDDGETGLHSGPRVPKDDPLLEAYGTIDELNSILGTLQTEGPSPQLSKKILRIQHELLDVGSDLATPWSKKSSRLSPTLVEVLEEEIDKAEKDLEPLTQFLLPGGSKPSAWLHLARTVCRRAERLAVKARREKEINPEVLVYLNRLSDWFFVMARAENAHHGMKDVVWKKGLVG